MDTKLNRDELFLIAMDLDISSLINLCKSSKLINEKICNNNIFWRNKLYKDCPNALMIPNNMITDYKALYRTVSKPVYSTYYVYSLKVKENQPAVLLDFVSKKYLSDKERNEYFGNILSPEDIQRLKTHEFFVQGYYPKGTKIWLYNYSLTSYIGRANTRERAIEEFILLMKKQGILSIIARQMPLEDFKNILSEKGEVEIVSDSEYIESFFVREFTLP
jgi:hypothetical protein